MYYSYILWSIGTKKFYTGSTDNIIKRVHYHNTTKRGFTQIGQPWQLVYVKEFLTRTEAFKMEKTIKTRGAARFIEDRINS